MSLQSAPPAPWRRLLPCLALSGALLHGSSADAQAAGAESPHQGAAPAGAAAQAVNAYVWSTSPVALPVGLVLGAGADYRRPIGAGGLFAGATLGLAQTSEATQEWQLQHVHGLAAAFAGWEWGQGRGRASVRLAAGALVIRQLGQRQQYERLLAAGVADLRRDAWSAGPWASAECGLSVAFVEGWDAFVRLGPGFTVQTVEGAAKGRFLLTSALGVGHAF